MNGSTGWGFRIFIAVLVVLHFVLRVGLGLDQLAPDLLVVALLLAAREIRAGAAAGFGLVLGVLDGSMVSASMSPLSTTGTPTLAILAPISAPIAAITRHLYTHR